MTSSHHALCLKATHVLQWSETEGSEAARQSKPQKPDLSSDRRLQTPRGESGKLAGERPAEGQFPGLVHTARHTTKVGNTRSR